MRRTPPSRPNVSASYPDEESVAIGLEIHENSITVNFTTSEHDGYIQIAVPWSLRRMRRNTNPAVFVDLIERLFPVEASFMGFNSRADLDAAMRRDRNETGSEKP